MWRRRSWYCLMGTRAKLARTLVAPPITRSRDDSGLRCGLWFRRPTRQGTEEAVLHALIVALVIDEVGDEVTDHGGVHQLEDRRMAIGHLQHQYGAGEGRPRDPGEEGRHAADHQQVELPACGLEPLGDPATD